MAAFFGEVASLVLMVAGIVLTAHNSPHVTRRAQQPPAPQPTAEKEASGGPLTRQRERGSR